MESPKDESLKDISQVQKIYHLAVGCEKNVRVMTILMSNCICWLGNYHDTSSHTKGINEKTFYIVAQDKRSTNQNSGVHIDVIDPNENRQTYYGCIEKILELDYAPNFTVPLF